MFRSRLACCIRTLTAAAAVLLAAAASAGEPEVTLELILEGNVSPATPQRWMPVLSAAGFSQPAIRSAQNGDGMEIVTGGSADNVRYQVRGVLTSSGNIRLPPGREFSLRDAKALGEWVKQLKAQGPETTPGGATPFGLTPSRLEEVKTDLAKVVSAATRGSAPTDALGEIAKGLNIPLVVDDAAKKALSESGNVRDQLQGFSSGTAIAALIRPAGLVLRPRFNGRTEYLVTPAETAGDNWPIGWKSSQSPGRLVPGLFEQEQTQAVEVPLSAALAELEDRVKAPFLYDYNSLALNDVDLAQTKVQMKAGKTFYGRMLSRILTKAKLDYEVRVDDAGRAFLWISSAKRS